MYNWRLLLAIFAVFQPIASFTEHNLVDGRQQCCDHRLSRDSAYSLNGDRFKSEYRRITVQPREIREERRDDRRNENFAARSSSIDTFRNSHRERELRIRLSRTEFRQERESEVRRSISHQQQARNYGAAGTSTDRIRNAENRRDDHFRNTRTDDESRLSRSRNIDENLEGQRLRNVRSEENLVFRERNVDGGSILKIHRDNSFRNVRFEDNRVLRARNIVEKLEQPDSRRDSSFRNTRSEENRMFRERNIDEKLEQSRRDNNLRNTRSEENLAVRARNIDEKLEQRESRRDNRFRNTRSEENRVFRARNIDEKPEQRESRRDNRFRNTRSEENRVVGARNIDEKLEQRESRRDNRFRNTRSEDNRVFRARNIDEKPEQRESHRDNRFRNTRSEENRVFQARNIDEKLEQRESRRDNRFRNTRSEENRVVRARNIDEKLEQRESRRDNRLRNKRSEENRVLRARNIDERLEQRETRRDNSYTNARFEENRVFRARNIDEKPEQRESRRDNSYRNARSEENSMIHGRNVDRTIELRLTRGIRLMHDNVDEVRRNRDLRDTRNELRRSRATDTRRVESDGTLDRRTSDNRFALRNQRDIRSLDRLSRGSNDDRRLSFEDRENGEMRERKHYDVNEAERRNIELRVRERLDIRREIGSRLATTRRDVNNRDGHLLMHSTRRTNEIRVSTNIGDRAYENKLAKNNLYGFRNVQLVADDRIEIRNRRQQLRETLRNTQRDIGQRALMNREEKVLRDESRARRDTNDERRVIRRRINSEQREVRENQRRNFENRDFRTGNDERKMRTVFKSRLSRRDSRIVEREISQGTADRMQARAVDEMKEFNRNIIVRKTTERQNIDSRTKYNSDSSRNQVSTVGNNRAKDENKTYENNWQILIYTMQGIYLCSIFIPMLMNNSSYKKKTKSLGLRTPFQALIKTH